MNQSINRLTERQVREAGEGRHADGGYLFLVVRGASKSWVVRGPRQNGKRIEAGLGRVDQVSTAHARRKRDELLAQVRNGLNPIEEKRKARQAEERRKTFAQTAQGVIDTHRSSWRKSEVDERESTLVQWTKDMTVICKPIADRFVDEITVEDIKAIVAPFFAAGHRDRALALVGRIEKVFGSAIWQGWRTFANPASVKMFAQHHPKPKGEDPHHAAIDWRAAPELMSRLRASTAVGARLVEFIMLTAARSGEARGALWSEVDFDRRVWTVPGSRMKKGKEHAVPLSDQAIELLHRMEAERVGEIVFPGGRGEIAQAADRPMRNASLWALVQRAAGGEATTHGFRSAFKDWANNQGVDHQLSERALAHDIGDATVTAYARDTLTERRRPMMEAWGAFLDGVAPRDNVVQLKRMA